MSWFESSKDRDKKLEELARQAIIKIGIPIRDFGPTPHGYYSHDLKGVGASKKDSEGALRDFEASILRHRPEYVSSIKIYEEELTWQKLPRRAILVVGYWKNSAA